MTAAWRPGLLTLLLALTAAGPAAADAKGAPKAAVVKSADGVPIAYEVHGAKTPLALVFVHGWSCDRGYWKDQVEPFARFYRVVAVDMAGHGESGVDRAAWTISAFAGDVVAVVEKLGLKRVILVGHSMGGDVIVEAARRLPGRVAGLVWVDTYKQLATPRPPEQVEAMVAAFREGFAEKARMFVRGMFAANADPALVERVAADVSAAPPAVALGTMEAALSFDREIPRALAELKLPVVAINPDQGPTDVASLEGHGVEVVIMPGVGHFLHMEDPARFNRILRTTVEKLAAAGRK
jgi:pimeloyl-ACP methyl ester carboxylesterase